MEFVALDFETANVDYSSICQIGIAHFRDGKIIDTWESLIDPEDYFDGFNISIHGITPDDVINAPVFSEVYSELKERLSNKIVIHHTGFDRIALLRAINKYGLEQLPITFLDSAMVARRAWEEVQRKGYGLKPLSEKLGINFNHHDALEDAIACGKIFLKAREKSETDISYWIERVLQPISLPEFTINEDGNLAGHNIAFTGSFISGIKSDLKHLAANVGAFVKDKDSVSKKTTILVVGIQDLVRTKGHQKSSKHRKAEQLIEQGHEIHIISEDNFFQLINSEEMITNS